MTEIYLHIVARMADYMDTHPYYQVGVRQKWSQVACGRSHVLVLDPQGDVWSWGKNTYGQMGEGIAGKGARPPHKPCMTDIYLYIDARMAYYIHTHPYLSLISIADSRAPSLDLAQSPSRSVSLSRLTDWECPYMMRRLSRTAVGDEGQVHRDSSCRAV